jgi:hypothetical protein
MKYLMITLILGLIPFSSCDYCKLLGEENLGSNFSLIEADKDHIYINYCITDGCCDAGIKAIPSKVVDVSFDYFFIIAKSRNSENDEYWIVNKNFDFDLEECRDKNCREIVNSNILGPLTHSEYKTKKDSLGINLNFN